MKRICLDAAAVLAAPLVFLAFIAAFYASLARRLWKMRPPA